MGHFSRQQILLHWLALLLITITYAAIELKGWVPKTDPWHAYLKLIHFNTGCMVFVVMAIRIWLRHHNSTPAITPPLPAWQQTLSTLVQRTMYVCFLLLPVLGVEMLAMAGKHWELLGFSMPVVAAPDKDMAKIIKNIHEFIADACYFLIAMHAGAAIYHHYMLKDNTLKRMLPFKKK